MDFVKLRKDLKCFVISSCLLAGQFPDCWMFSLSSSRVWGVEKVSKTSRGVKSSKESCESGNSSDLLRGRGCQIVY